MVRCCCWAFRGRWGCCSARPWRLVLGKEVGPPARCPFSVSFFLGEGSLLQEKMYFYFDLSTGGPKGRIWAGGVAWANLGGWGCLGEFGAGVGGVG